MKFHTSTIALALLFGGFIWIADNVIDYFFFYNEPFWDMLLFKVHPHELYIRLVFIVAFLIFGLILSSTIAKKNKLNEMLQENEDRFRTLFESANDAIFIMKDAKFTLCNKATLDVFGCKDKSEIIDHFIWDFSPEYQPDGTLSKKQSRLKIEMAYLEESQKFYWQHKKKNGDIFDAEISLSSFVLNGKRFLQAIVRDITVQKKYEDAINTEKEKLRTTLNSIGDAVIATDSKGLVDRMNPVAESLTGWTTLEAKGMDLEEVFNIVNSQTRIKVKNPVEVVLKEGKIVGLANHTLLISRDGSEFQIADSASPIRSENGKITGVVLVFRDVTEEYQKSQELKDSEELLNAVFNSIQEGISVLNPDLSIRYVNQIMEEWYPDKPALPGKKCYYCYHNADLPCDPCPSLRCLESGNMESDIIVEHSDESNHPRWIELYSYPIIDSKTNEITGVAEFVKDITAQMLANEKLKQSEENLRTTLNSIGDAVITTDTNGIITNINPVAGQLTGWETNSAKGKMLDEVFNIVNAKTREKINNPVEKVLEKGQIVGMANHTMLISKEGYGYQIADSASPIKNDAGEITGVVLVFRDVTEEYAVQEQLKLSEMRLRQIIDLVPHLIFAKDENGAYLMANKAMADFYSTTSENLTGQTDADFNPNKEMVDYIINEDKKVFDSGKKVFTKSEKIIDSSGSLYYLQTTRIPFLTSDKDIPAVLGVAIDITDAKIAEDILKESEERYQRLFSSTAEGIWVINNDRITIDVNEAFCKMMGYTKDEMLGKTPFDFADDENKKIFSRHTSKIPTSDNRSYEITVKKKNGDDLNVIINATTVFDKDRNVIASYGFINDITERKQIENRIIESENQLRQIIQGSPIPTFVINKDHEITHWNEALSNITSTVTEKMVGTKDHWRAFYDNDRPTMADLIVNNTSRIEFETYYRDIYRESTFLDGAYEAEDFYPNLGENGTWLFFTAAPLKDKDGNIIGAIETLQDVTYRKTTENTLAEKEERLRLALAGGNLGTWDWNVKTGHVVFDDGWAKMLGYELEEIEPNVKSWEVLLHPDDKADVLKVLEDHIHGKTDHYQSEHRVLTKSGEWKWVLDRGEVTARDENGTPLRAVGTHLDISEIKMLELSLLENERQVKEIISSVPGAVYRFKISNEGKAEILYMSDRADELFERPIEELWDATRLFDDMDPKDKVIMWEEIKLSAKEMTPFDHQFKIFPANGRKKWLRAMSNPGLQDDGSIIWTGVITDISAQKAAEQEVLIERDKAQMYLDVAGVIMLAIDKDGNVMLLNQKGCEILEGTEEEIIGKNWFHTFLPDNVRENTYQVFLTLMEGNMEMFEYHEQEILTLNNNIRMIAWHNTILKDSEGNIIGTLSSGEDITEIRKDRQELIASEERYRAIFENSAIGIGVRDMDNRYVQFNDHYLNMLGYTEAELQELKPEHITHPDDINISVTNLNAIKEGKAKISRYQKRYLTKQGEIVWAEVSVQGLVNNEGEVFALTGVVNDITDRKLAEEALIKAKDKAEESDRLKSAFLANMSHEIRTPMNGILGFAGLLKDTEISSDEQLEYAAIIETSGERMLNVLNDLIDIAKIESEQMEVNYDNFNLNDQIEYLFDFFSLETDTKGLTFSYAKGLSNDNAMIKSDKTKINAILTNLIKNAIKYTEEGEITFGYELKSKKLEFWVKDTGIGIPQEKLDIIFDRFVQADLGTTRSYEGAGLGLSISKAYVELLNGRLWVESLEGYGSTFFFTMDYLPVFTNADNEQNVVSSGFGVLKDRKVLIVDDDEPGLVYLQRLLRNKCKELITARNGLDALGIFKENQDIDLILIDIKMPVLDGYEASRMIRDISKDVVIIAQTAFALKDEEEKAIKSGCNDHIAKPFKEKDLFRVIRKYIG